MKANYWTFYRYSKIIVVSIYDSFKEKKMVKKNYSSEQEKQEEFLDNVIKNQFELLPRISHHKSLFLTAIDTWKMNKIFGNGIKSFRKECLKVIQIHYKYHGDPQKLLKRYRTCSNHPHNYYLEILTETGLAGVSFIILFYLILLIFTLRFLLRYKNKINESNLVLLASLISLVLELFPLRSSGSFFSTQNAAFITFILSIVFNQ